VGKTQIFLKKRPKSEREQDFFLSRSSVSKGEHSDTRKQIVPSCYPANRMARFFFFEPQGQLAVKPTALVGGVTLL